MIARLLAADAALLMRVRRLEVPWATRLMRAFTRAGDASSWIAIAVIVTAIGGTAARPAALLLAAAMLGTVLSQILKRSLVRPRPCPKVVGFSALAEHPDRFSFPSGHTTVAFAVAIALAGEGAFLGPACLALATGVGTSRVYLGAHYPLDVAAGAVLGSLVGVATRWMLL